MIQFFCFSDLEKYEEIAKEGKLGMWNDEAGVAQSTVRNITWAVNDGKDFYNSFFFLNFVECFFFS